MIPGFTIPPLYIFPLVCLPTPSIFVIGYEVAFVKFEEKVLIPLDVFAISLGKYLLGHYG